MSKRTSRSTPQPYYANKVKGMKELEDAVFGKNVVTITFTEDDWNEEAQAYVKNVQLNNTYVFLDFHLIATDKEIWIRNPYMQGLVDNGFTVSYFAGIETTPEEREIDFDTSDNNLPKYISIFNGIVTCIKFEL